MKKMLLPAAALWLLVSAAEAGPRHPGPEKFSAAHPIRLPNVEVDAVRPAHSPARRALPSHSAPAHATPTRPHY